MSADTDPLVEAFARDGRGEERERALESVRASATLLLSELRRPPTMLRLRAGEVAVELRWEEPVTVAAPAPAAPQTLAPTATPPGAPAMPQEPALTATPEPERELTFVRSPTVGVFYLAPEPGAAPFVAEGDQVAPGQQVGIVEVMKMMIPVEAGCHGRVVSVMKPDAAPVEFDEQLLSLEPVG
ncbi:acetyl-CoA carboxylase biotin carboxyl carrier protein [Nonomuraea typhae]|uniref:acetyl-CoA carboxylase biotin carboxyl carrier protein n=1 Tax=Nonomuraea typhae TaxID=2603600 RepID=UPI0012F724EB|nr:biotin/lipoyl-containing protein [Nonomuraea typhae]